MIKVIVITCYSLSWKDKSWVIGVKAGKEKKVYDWNQLKTERIINDKLDGKNIILVLAKDNKKKIAFENPDAANIFSLHNDTLVQNNIQFAIRLLRIQKNIRMQV